MKNKSKVIMAGIENKNVSFHASFQKGIKNIFQLAAFVIILGCLVDILQFSSKDQFLVILNYGTIFISVLLLTLYYSRKLSYRLGFIILIYTILSNLYLGKFLNQNIIENSVRLDFFLRDSIFVISLLTLASFAIHRIHSIVIGMTYLVICYLFSRSVNIPFLSNSLVLISFAVISFSGLIWYLVGIFEKVNSEQEKQSELIRIQSAELSKRNDELAQLNRSKDMMMSVIGHDLKNPFNVIQLSTQILLSKSGTLTEEKKNDIIGIIDKTSAKTYLLLENLLKWARLHTESIRYLPQLVSLNKIIGECLDLFNESIVMKKLTVQFEKETDYEVYADKDMVGTIVRNLISNAIKFSHTNGTIIIECENQDQHVKCTVADNGIGLKKQEIENLFNIEKLTIGTGTGGETGTGLGLLLCRDFLAMNRGNLIVESQEGRGSRFSFILPVSE